MKYRSAVVVLSLFAGVAWGQQPPRKPPAAQQPEVLKSYVADRLAGVERELADLIQERVGTASQDLPYLELRIDLRILQRWLTRQLLSPEPYSDAQAVIWLRHRDLSDVIATVDGWAKTQSGVATKRTQTEAMTAIRKATYDLKDAADTGAIDALLVPLRTPLLAALGDATGKAPDMRPEIRKPVTTAPTDHDDPAPAEPPSLDQLATRVSQLTVSMALRQQLIACIAAARVADEDERGKLLGMLRNAVELAQAIQSNLGVDATSRATIETSLSEAVALFSDPRLRDAGQARLDNLQQYRALAGRVTSLALAPEVMRAIAPAFAYARENPDAATKILGAIEAFAALEAEIAQHKPAAATDLVGRQIEANYRAVLNERAGFLEEAGKLKGSGMFVSNPDDLQKRIASMRTALDTVRTLKQLSATQQILLELKPRPTGALEKRMTQAVAKLADPDAAQRESGRAYLHQLDELATHWDALQKLLVGADEPAAQKYAGLAWSALQTRARTLATDAVNIAASTGSADTAKIDAIKRLAPLVEQIRMLGQLEQRLATTDSLNRWADCTLNQERISRLLDTYRADFAAIVASTLKGDPDARETQQLRQRYRGLLTTLETLALAAEGSAQLPEGPRGQIARLTTPSHNSPHARIRYLSLMTDLIELTRMSALTDADAISKLEGQMLQRLNRKQ